MFAQGIFCGQGRAESILSQDLHLPLLLLMLQANNGTANSAAAARQELPGQQAGDSSDELGTGEDRAAIAGGRGEDDELDDDLEDDINPLLQVMDASLGRRDMDLLLHSAPALNILAWQKASTLSVMMLKP